ncbi:MAG TPA: PotD/PotF family extracellular solute-binding protein, partial [Polyangiaceae bacterium]
AMVILASAPNKAAAHKFVNHVLDPEVGAAISNFTGYGSPNQAAFGAIENPIPLPTPEERRRLEYLEDLGPARVLWDKLWTEIKNG